MKFFQRSKSILGMNARNLNYVGHFNTGESKTFADNKMYTKNFLTTRGIGAAKLYLVIKQYKELTQVDPKTLPARFVIKPNRGYGGEGIIVIREHKDLTFIDIDGDKLSWKDLYHHMVSILDGKYAISGMFDHVIFEELLEPHEYFRQFIERGLPDIRIIVFNYVPIIAMLRLPTSQSKGKANLHLGAIGIGIDIATGRATYAVRHNKFIRKLENGEKVTSIEIPNWDEILLTAAKAQHASQIKFVAVDVALTSTGIKVLELNARAGLGVQIANQVPLKRRLDKVVDLKIPNPEKGIEVTKALFGVRVETEKKASGHHKEVVGLFEEVSILNSPYETVRAKIDPHSQSVILDWSLSEFDPQERYIDIMLRGQRVRAPFEFGTITDGCQIVIGGKFLQDFVIDPNLQLIQKVEHTKNTSTKKNVHEKILKNLDKKVADISQQINILSFVKPLNLIEEKERFFTDFSVAPYFVYRKPSFDFENILREIRALPHEVEHPLSQLYIEKIKELITTLELIDAVGTPEFSGLSEQLYEKVDDALYHTALDYIAKNPIREDTGKKVGVKTIVKKLQIFLKDNNLHNWKVKVQERQTADIAINKQGSILVKSDVKFTHNRLKAVIAHEICTHIYRLENARQLPFKIFEQGTAHYLQTEEGLAIYNQKALNINLGEKDIWAALRVVAIFMAQKMSFSELFAFFTEQYGLDKDSAWKTCVKAKRGLVDTSQLGGFTRDAVYFRGYLEVSKYLQTHGTTTGLEELYSGKISLDDVSYLQYLEKYKVKYLPPSEIDV